MDLIINGPAVALSSRGVRRYFGAVMSSLSWDGRVEVIPRGRWTIMERPRELVRRGRRDAIFWTPCQRGPLRAQHHVVTVHDCINVEYVYQRDWRLPMYRRMFNQVLARAEAVVAISNSTKAAILRNYEIDEAKITVIRSGCDPFDVPVDAAVCGTPDRGELAPYVLMVTNTLPHKNHLAACEALARSRVRELGVQLRVVGSLSAAALETCRRAGIGLELQSSAGDAELRVWYEGCLFMLSPSVAEGHDLPIAEALSLGANVLCSDIDAHREFYDGRARFFDPHDVESIATAIDSALQLRGRWFDPPASPRLRSFADVAQQYRALFKSIESRC